jgi:hypothetical protein
LFAFNHEASERQRQEWRDESEEQHSEGVLVRDESNVKRRRYFHDNRGREND